MLFVSINLLYDLIMLITYLIDEIFLFIFYKNTKLIPLTKLDYTIMNKNNNEIDISNIIINNDVITFAEIINNKIKIDRKLIILLLQNKQFEMLEVVNSNYSNINESILNISISLKDIEIINNLLIYGHKWNVYSFSHAINTINIDIIKYVRSKGCFMGIINEHHDKIIKSNSEIKYFIQSISN